MVIRGRTRGHGRQLGQYLLAMGENDHIAILDVNGRLNPTADDLHQALQAMSLMEELTKSDKGIYHAQINPAYGDDAAMNSEDWLKAADMLGKELGFEHQSRVMVLHTKKGRIHAHVAWERFDNEKGIMISDSFSRLAQDRVRKKMELVFEQKQTPHRNLHRPEMKEHLTKLWQETTDAEAFIKAANAAGYNIATGQQRPFMVVDGNGRSYDLVRQLGGINTKAVRERFGNRKLPSERKAINDIRKQQSEKSFIASQERLIDKIDMHNQEKEFKGEQKAKAEQPNVVNIRSNDPKVKITYTPMPPIGPQRIEQQKIGTLQGQQPEASKIPKQEQAAQFADNREDAINKPTDNQRTEEEKEQERQRLRQEMQQKRESKRNLFKENTPETTGQEETETAAEEQTEQQKKLTEFKQNSPVPNNTETEQEKKRRELQEQIQQMREQQKRNITRRR